MERQLIPLASLPGFDSEGLVIYGLGLSLYDEVEMDPPAKPWVQVWSHGMSIQHQREMCEVDASDTSVSDRIARWIAERVGLAVGVTGPYLGFDAEVGWYLSGLEDVWFAHNIEGLPGLLPESADPLSGPQPLACLALATMAVQVGAAPPPPAGSAPPREEE